MIISVETKKITYRSQPASRHWLNHNAALVPVFDRLGSPNWFILEYWWGSKKDIFGYDSYSKLLRLRIDRNAQEPIDQWTEFEKHTKHIAHVPKELLDFLTNVERTALFITDEQLNRETEARFEAQRIRYETHATKKTWWTTLLLRLWRLIK